MRDLTCIICLSLLGAGLPGSRSASAEPAAPAGSDDAAGKTLFGEERYAEAAAVFEGLWDEQRAPRFLLNAALAREMAGHELQAFIHLRRYLTLQDLEPTAQATAQDRIVALRGRTVRLRVLVSPADLPNEGLLWSFVRDAGSPSASARSAFQMDGQAFAVVAVPGHPGAYDLHVERGDWTLEVSASNYRTRRERLTIARAGSIVLGLEPMSPPLPRVSSTKPRPAPTERDRPQRLPLALGVSGGVVAGLGVGLLVSGYRAPVNLALDDAKYTAEDRQQYRGYLSEDRVGRAHDLIGSGALLVGTAGGLWVGAGAATLRPGKRPMFALLGTGIALGVAGGVAYSVTWSQTRALDFADENRAVAPDAWRTYKGQIVGANVVAGLGVGMAASALIGLIARRISRASDRHVHLQPIFHRAGVSFAAHWRF